MDYVWTVTPRQRGFLLSVLKIDLLKIIQKIDIHCLCFYLIIICDIDNEGY